MIQWCVSPPHDPRFISRKLLIKFIHNPKATQVLMLGERECANSHSFSFLFNEASWRHTCVALRAWFTKKHKEFLSMQDSSHVLSILQINLLVYMAYLN